MRDDDLDRLASRQTSASRPEIQRPSTAEIEQFISDNRLLSAANGMSYSAINPIRYIKMSNRNAAAGVIRLVRDGKVEQWVFYKESGELIGNRVSALRRKGSASAKGFSGVIAVSELKGTAWTAYVYKRGRLQRIYVGDGTGSSVKGGNMMVSKRVGTGRYMRPVWSRAGMGRVP